MKEWTVTNRTQGRLELHSIRKVLEFGESVDVAEPIPEEIKYLLGEKKIFLVEVVTPLANTKAVSPRISTKKPEDGKSSPKEPETKSGKKPKADE